MPAMHGWLGRRPAASACRGERNAIYAHYIKIYLDDPEIVQPDDFTAVFHTWIQKGAVEGLLLDVADYQHIQDGPGMILIGDQVDYAFDLGRGGSGLLVRRKFRGTDVYRCNPRYRIRSPSPCACHALEIDPALREKSLSERRSGDRFPGPLPRPEYT